MIEKALQALEKIKAGPSKIVDEQLIRKIISLIDYTTLNDDDHDESVNQWQLDSIVQMKSVNAFCGAWCIYPEFIPIINQNKADLDISTAAVCGNFPSGKALTQLKIEEALLIESLGADEIDVVINKGWAVKSAYGKIAKEIELINGSLGKIHLKVIMETGMLDHSGIYEISKAVIHSGADFIKTSTGKTSIGATPEAVAIMCHVIKEHYLKTGKKVGIKPSGGISTPAEAINYLLIVEEILGEEWMNNQLFRIGASRLLNNCIYQLPKS